MESAFELVTFVTRAENRVTVTTALASGSYTRQELQETTDIPRATLNRILSDLRDYGIVVRDGGEYTATPLGERLAADLRSLFRRIETMEKLRTIERWLPTDAFDFDLTRLATGKVTLPTPADPLALVDRASGAVLDAERFWLVSSSATPDTLEASWRAISADQGAFDVVITPDIVDVIAVDPEIDTLLRELVDPDRPGIWIYGGHMSHNLALVDGTVFIRVHDEEGAIKGLVATDDEVVRSWAVATSEVYKREAEPVGIEELYRPRTTEAGDRSGHAHRRSAGRAEEMELVRRVYEEAWGKEVNLDLIDEYVADEFVRHVPYKPDVHGAEEYKEHVAGYHEAFRDAESTVEEIVVQGDRYVFRWKARGTHVGEFAGIEPSGERVEFPGLTMARFEDGRCVEEWSFGGATALLQ